MPFLLSNINSHFKVIKKDSAKKKKITKTNTLAKRNSSFIKLEEKIAFTNDIKFLRLSSVNKKKKKMKRNITNGKNWSLNLLTACSPNRNNINNLHRYRTAACRSSQNAVSFISL